MMRLSFSVSLGVTLSFVTPIGCDSSPSKFSLGLLSGLPDSYLLPVYTPGWREALS